MQGAPRVSCGGGGGGTATVRGAPPAMRPEVKAANKLIAAPAPVPSPATLTIGKRKLFNEQLHAHDNLYAIHQWTREILEPVPSREEQPPTAAGTSATLQAKMVDWTTRGEQASTLGEAHGTAVEDLLCESRALAADLARLRKCTRLEDCDAAVRAREEVPGANVAFVQILPTATHRVESAQLTVPLPADRLREL